MLLKRIFIFLIFFLLGLQLIFQNCEYLAQKIFELRQMYIIERSDNLTTFIFSKKEYASLNDKKEIFIDGKYYDVKLVEDLNTSVRLVVIEDKNENFIKYISHSLKQEKKKKNKVEAKRRLILALPNKDFDEIKLTYSTKVQTKFYLKLRKHIKVHLPLLRPPDYL